ncbi:MAG: hypothetical protein JNL57_09695 [Bacteroidetes bacterium]|nr:hypothetical protein [Bacteroidota bacterium]
MENFTDTQVEKRRTTLLTVLCILTWIGSAFGLLGGFSNTFGKGPREQLNQMQEQMDKMGSDNPAASMMEGIANNMAANMETLEKWTRPLGILALIGVVLCLIGSIMMWKLQKRGFFIYAVGELLPGIISLPLMWNFIMGMTGMMGTITKAMTVGGFVIALIMVFLYYRQTKYMND